jgi:hypothetical protein
MKRTIAAIELESGYENREKAAERRALRRVRVEIGKLLMLRCEVL